MIESLNSSTVSLVKLALDVSIENQKLITHNLANINTTGFKPLRFDFSAVFNDQLQSQVDQNQYAEIGQTKKAVNSGEFTTESSEKTSLEKEMVEMADNVVRYRALLEMLSSRGKIMSMAMRDKGA